MPRGTEKIPGQYVPPNTHLVKSVIEDRMPTITMFWRLEKHDHEPWYIFAKGWRGCWFGTVHNFGRTVGAANITHVGTLWKTGKMDFKTFPEKGRTYLQKETP